MVKPIACGDPAVVPDIDDPLPFEHCKVDLQSILEILILVRVGEYE